MESNPSMTSLFRETIRMSTQDVTAVFTTAALLEEDGLP
jgi:hypothetical protein